MSEIQNSATDATSRKQTILDAMLSIVISHNAEGEHRLEAARLIRLIDSGSL